LSVFLYAATFTVNLLALALAVWLGLYLVSRNPRYLIAWLTALMLWLMAGLFFNVLLAISPASLITIKPILLRFLFPFWPSEAIAGEPNNWLQGWSVTPALALWHHVTVLLLPGKLSSWRWIRIMLGYLLAVVAGLVQTSAQILFAPHSSDPLYLNSLQAGPWYPLFGAALLLMTYICVFNLVRATRAAPSSMAHSQLANLTKATLIICLLGPISIAGSYFQVPIPMVVVSLCAAIPLGVIGMGIARYSALMEGRTSQRDFTYQLVLLGLVLLVYIPLSWMVYRMYNAPMVVIIFFPILAVITHFLSTIVFQLLDRFFYQKETRQLRQELHQLSRQVGTHETLEELLGHSLDTLARTVGASYGLILVFEDGLARQVTGYRLEAALPSLDPHSLHADDVMHLKLNQFPAPLEEAALLVPLYGESEQLGALLLGRPLNGLHYAKADVERILEFTDRMGETIQVDRHNAQYLAQIARLVQAQKPVSVQNNIPVTIDSLEAALHNLYDYTALADNPLAELRLVQNRLGVGEATHLERGKMVYSILIEAMEKLRPSPTEPAYPPSREWHPYLILQEAYLKETSNRDIMLKLYISEGTFNRTRRSAVRSLARALGEMEAAIP
jgi:hypothetical protein